MKQLFILFAIAIFCAIGAPLLLKSCDNELAKHWGQTIQVDIPNGYKVTEATWKDNSLWVLTEPMESNYTPQTKVFREVSEYGLLEGSVEFHEHKLDSVVDYPYGNPEGNPD